MKIYRLCLLIVTTVFICAIGCSVFKGANTVEVTNSNTAVSNDNSMPESGGAKAAANQDIRKVDFKNFTYEPQCAGEDTQKITVKKGEFSREKQEEGYVDRFYFNITGISYGDLNGDDSEEAVILTGCNTGGTGNFSEGFIYTLKDGKPVLFARIPGGDRADGGLREARVENGQLIVESNDPGEEGGACCPQYAVTTKYDASTGKLKQVGTSSKRSLFPSQRISFPKGTSGTIVNVKIPAMEGKRYLLGAQAGQTLEVSLNTDKATARLLEDADVKDNPKGFSALLPKNGDYTIEVTNYEGSALDVTINIRIR
jgi:hypothetical protein